MSAHAESGATLVTDLSDGVLTLTLQRPEARNALSPRLVTALDEAGTGSSRTTRFGRA
ncbi:hypothetical protein LO772_31010 [Yinghuangia sp. ASG 101]|uniref:hypothetical protein n=1 Tax=Yinghuangia sp. ASG 101 TaxID=2896848 RepID=UPI001E510F17|nr:hypothetical protein [Yinghuangia sp. ASG 101]UGQ11185.1 hypothetical protein LO772_31010 [Yinghuangia sp. ASG 101]